METGAEIQEIFVGELIFNPNLQFGYRKRTELEPDLLESQEKIKWADHLVWVFPVWWGGMPAVLKGFIDRVFLPGFAFQKRENSLWWDKLLINKSARIITTMDQPTWYYWLVYKQPSTQMLKKTTLQFCGVSPVRVTSFGPIRLSSQAFRLKAVKKVEELGTKLG